jgi:TonB-linked SusC/RagA family outer membrane protein
MCVATSQAYGQGSTQVARTDWAVRAGESLLDRPARLDVRDAPLSEALHALTRSSSVQLAFSPSALPAGRATCVCTAVTVREALERLLVGTRFGYREAEQQVVITPPVPATWAIQARLDRVAMGVPRSQHLGGFAGTDPSALTRQEVGFVAGTVVNATSGTTLSGVQIVQVGTESGVLSDAAGRFRLRVASGADVTLRAVLIGYRTTEATVRIGQANVILSMNPMAVELDAIVVTGTAGDQRKRAIGNAVGSIDVGQLNQVAPSPDLVQMLNGRAAGVVINPGGGEVGSGGNIRVRGLSSPSLDNAPLVYIDGIRVEGQDANLRFFYVGSLWNTSRLNDLDPAQIESIEVLKGPAAATLYGTEASNGVINIITKRGTQGATKVNLNIEHGANFLQNPEGTFPRVYYKGPGGAIETFSTVQNETDRGTPFFRTGQRARYGIDVSGGSPALQFFTSLGYETDESPFRINDLSRFNTRLNVDAVVTPKLQLSAGAGFTRGVIHPGGNANGSPLACAFYPDPTLRDTPNRGCTRGPPEAFGQAWDRTQNLNRFTTDIQLAFRPWSWLSTRLRAGTDLVDQTNIALVERLPDDIAPYFGRDAVGRKDEQRATVTNRTLDASGTATAGLGPSWSSSTSAGLQVYQETTELLSVHAEEFPVLGLTSVSSAALATSSEQYVENVTVGTYLQEQFSWKDRLFLTAAIRADDNSAFGESFDLVTYPKVSAAWVVSEEPFWPLDVVGTLRLRMAYGQAGRQPDAFSALQTYEPFVGRGGVATIRPQFSGNPDLGPERGEEIEVGFEASLLDDRVGLDFTYYDKHTRDAILLRDVAPSMGFPQAQYVNVGEVANSGVELLVKGTPLRTEGARWDIGVNIATNHNEVVSLGGLPPIPGLIRVRLEEGYPIGAWFEKKVVSADVTSEGKVTNILCDPGDAGGAPVACASAPRVYLGDDTPDVTGNVSSTLTLFDRLTLYAMFDFKRGHRIYNFARRVVCQSYRQCPENVDPASNPIWAAEAELGIWGESVFQDASFVKFRQLSATYRLPQEWATGFGLSAASVTVSGRNLHTWSDWWGGDPETQDILTGVNTVNLQQGDLPHPTQFVVSFKVTF